MNPEQQQSLVRSVILPILGFGIGYLVTAGFLTQDQANQLIPAIGTVILIGASAGIAKWGVNAHSPAAVVAAVNSDSVPGVKAVAETAAAPRVTVDAKTGKIEGAETVTIR